MKNTQQILLLLYCIFIFISIPISYSHADKAKDKSLTEINAHNEQALLLAAKGEYALENTMLLEILSESKEILGNQHIDISYIHQNLGITYWRIGEFGNGLKHLVVSRSKCNTYNQNGTF